MGPSFRRFVGIAADIAPGIAIFSLVGQFIFSEETAKILAILGGLIFIISPYLLWMAASLGTVRGEGDKEQ